MCEDFISMLRHTSRIWPTCWCERDVFS